VAGLGHGHNRVVTISTAPDYCTRQGNKAGIMELGVNCQRREIRFNPPRAFIAHNADLPRYFRFDDF
jgi:hypothetical protein